MNKLYHYGDSYAGTANSNIKHFVEIISDILSYEYVQLGVGGSCNEQILNEFLKNILNYKSGDIIFFNFSFFVRGAYFDKKLNKIMSGNHIVNDLLGKITKDGLNGMEQIMGVLTYQLENTEDYNKKIFHLFNTTFELLINKGVKIYYLYIKNSDFSDELLKYGTNIKFEKDFYGWLHEKGFHNNEECHYTKGIQKYISDHIILNTPELFDLCSSKEYIPTYKLI